MGLLDKMKSFVSSSAPASAAGADVAGDGESDLLEISFATPAAEATTCAIRFDRMVAPAGTALFETPQEAVGWPAVEALLGIPGVHSVISKGEVLIVAKREAPAWPEILSQVESAVRRAFEAVPGESADAAQGEARSEPASRAEADLQLRVQDVIEAEINPALDMHGGYLELLDVQGTRIFVHMGGGCQGCSMSTQTLKHGVETTLRARIPEISEVLDTTDHAAGSNPYYHA